MTTIKIHNCETNEVIEVPMSAEQIAEIAASNQAREDERAAAAAAKQAVLDKLGLTAEELSAVLS